MQINIRNSEEISLEIYYFFYFLFSYSYKICLPLQLVPELIEEGARVYIK